MYVCIALGYEVLHHRVSEGGPELLEGSFNVAVL